MDQIDWRKHVVIDPGIHHGGPCIKGTRIPVSMIAGSVASGMSHDEIMAEYPHLTREDIHAAVVCAHHQAYH